MNNNDNKLLYYYPTLELFKTKLAANQVNDAAINLIQDKGILYTRGTYINLSDILISNNVPTDDQLLWVDMSADGEAVSEKIYIGTTEPTDGQLLWINPDTNEIKYNNSGTWTAIGGGVEEAPIDGKYYARKDGEWAAAGSTITLIAETNTGDNTDLVDVVFTVTIDGVTLLVNNGSRISVESGKTVKIKCPPVENYFTPASVEFTTELFLYYTKTFVYNYNTLGVFIQDKNGNLWNVGRWNESNNANANAIAVLTNNVKVLIALTDNRLFKPMSDSDTSPLENYCTEISLDNIYTDYNGKTNTANIIKTVSSTKYAAGWANAFTFPDGTTKGHLPSVGELWESRLNQNAINTALEKCGGTLFDMESTYYSTSTFGGKENSTRYYWRIDFDSWGNFQPHKTVLTSGCYIRPFATLNL